MANKEKKTEENLYDKYSGDIVAAINDVLGIWDNLNQETQSEIWDRLHSILADDKGVSLSEKIHNEADVSFFWSNSQCDYCDKDSKYCRNCSFKGRKVKFIEDCVVKLDTECIGNVVIRNVVNEMQQLITGTYPIPDFIPTYQVMNWKNTLRNLLMDESGKFPIYEKSTTAIRLLNELCIVFDAVTDQESSDDLLRAIDKVINDWKNIS